MNTYSILAVVGALSFSACGGDIQSTIDGSADAGGTMDGGAHVSPCAAHAECDDAVFCNGVESCVPGMAGADPRGCMVAPEGPCMAGESCDESERECRSGCADEPDADGDGHDSMGCAGDDCDDDDGNRFPGNAEICDTTGHDEDCRPDTFGFQDLDSDGYVDATCCNTNPSDGLVLCGDDCNDMRAVSHPGRTEACDGFDNDCDEHVDEGALRTFYPDVDDDGFGDASGDAVMTCEPPADHVENAGDCDDTNPAAHSTSAPEVCDGADNDCDTTVDENTMVVAWHRDVDGDLFGDADDPAPVMSCLPVAGHVPNAGDCDDTLGVVNPSAPEACNGINEDCDAMTDEGVEMTYYRDADGDRHGAPAMTMTGCTAPTGYVASGDDCDDAVTTTHPGAPELCNNVDDDCSSGGGTITAEDADGDAYASLSAACSGGFPTNDCNDTNADVHPGNASYYQVPVSCPTNYIWCSSTACCIYDDPSPAAPPPFCIGSPPASCVTPANWDYDCSGSADPQPSNAMCIEAFGLCVGGGGPIYSGAPPRCGVGVMTRTCGRRVDGSCLAQVQTRPMSCH